MKPSRAQKRIAWLPTVLWAGFIFTMSTKYFSAAYTSNIIYPILLWLLPHAQHDTLMLLHELVRKAAHVTEYFIFSLLILRGIRAGRPEWRWRWSLIAIAAAGLYACTDEFHQIFVPGRFASPRDVLIDTTSAALAQVVAYLFARRAGREQPQT